jgi:aerobic-type carbon monoxide dehydrogenase small subunit (CoxS/CutS family)
LSQVQQPLTVIVNGDVFDLYVDPSTSLLQLVRDRVGLTGSKEGCDDSECGACMMLVDGRPVNSCSYLALQAGGRSVVTVEGLAAGGELHPLQRRLAEVGGVQCGYCTSGMLMSASALLARNGNPSEREIRQALAGNLCRCTGYRKIVEAVALAARDLNGETGTVVSGR